MTDTDEHAHGPPDPRQLSFDFVADEVKSRYRRRVWIQRMILKGRNAVRMKFLLWVIESHDGQNTGCSLHAQTIADEMNAPIKTVRRAISDCVNAGLITYKPHRSPLRASHFQIEWAAVAQRLLDDPKTIEIITKRERNPYAEPPSTWDTSGGSHGTLDASTWDTSGGSHGTLDAGTWDTCDGRTPRPDYIDPARALEPLLNQVLNQEEKNQAFPGELNSPEFREAWAKWGRHLTERGKLLSSVATDQQLANLAAMGSTRAVAALEHSLGNGWVTIYEPPSSRASREINQPGPGQKYDPTAVVGGM